MCEGYAVGSDLDNSQQPLIWRVNSALNVYIAGLFRAIPHRSDIAALKPRDWCLQAVQDRQQAIDLDWHLLRNQACPCWPLGMRLDAVWACCPGNIERTASVRQLKTVMFTDTRALTSGLDSSERMLHSVRPQPPPGGLGDHLLKRRVSYRFPA